MKKLGRCGSHLQKGARRGALFVSFAAAGTAYPREVVVAESKSVFAAPVRRHGSGIGVVVAADGGLGSDF
jgi:hypothetical protein